MDEIIVKTQKELDKVDINTRAVIKIDGGTRYDRIVVTKKYTWRVEARGNSSVEARENSSVVAWGSTSVHLFSEYSTVILFFFAVCWKHVASKKVTKKAKTATILVVPDCKGTFTDYLNRFPAKVTGKVATMYKAVHKYPDGTYHSGHNRDFTYTLGSVITENCDKEKMNVLTVFI